jgi:hypothetical protein
MFHKHAPTMVAILKIYKYSKNVIQSISVEKVSVTLLDTRFNALVDLGRQQGVSAVHICARRALLSRGKL